MTANSTPGSDTCGCCQGAERLTPLALDNRPGPSALAYRVGRHSSFLETMKARLSSGDFSALSGLTSREAHDPAIAWLDAWATLAEVLTFYQERLANEGYLRTATERRSILELARLVGYQLRPGVAASVYLAFTLDKDYQVEIPTGTRAQSLPAPGELPQPFETSEPLEARAEWNTLPVRLSQPQYLTFASIAPDTPIYLEGIATKLQPNDPLLFTFTIGTSASEGSNRLLYRVLTVKPEPAANRTRITAQLWGGEETSDDEETSGDGVTAGFSIGDLKNRYAGEGKLEAAARKFGAPTDSEVITRQIRPVLDRVWEGVVDPPPDDIFSIQKNLDALGAALAEVQKVYTDLGPRYRPLRAWLSNLMGEMKAAQQALVQKRAERLRLPGAMVRAALRADVTRSSIAAEWLVSPAMPEGVWQWQPAVPGAPSFKPERLNALTSDFVVQLLKPLSPRAQSVYYRMMADEYVSDMPPGVSVLQSVEALRVRAPLFGHNAPLQLDYVRANGVPKKDADNHFIMEGDVAPTRHIVWGSLANDNNKIALDAVYEHIKPGSWVVVEYPDDSNDPASFGRTPFQVTKTETVSLGAVGITARSTVLTLDDTWSPADSTDVLRRTTVYAQAETLNPADEPVTAVVEGGMIELAQLVPGLVPGRWLIVSGEQVDMGGITDGELVSLDSTTHDVQKIGLNLDLPGDRPHTFLRLAGAGLVHQYKPETVTVYGNVVKATHGETRQEVLGSGDGSTALQQFCLKQSPLTHVSAPTASGAQSTLEVRVDGIQWHEAEHLAGLGQDDRRFISRTDDENQTCITFGDGQHGARPPTGFENISAKYRSGIGLAGNLGAGRISLLATKPLGVKSVLNPLAASGGADRESRDQARRNVPLGVTALDRLVSVRDYADFARTFAGIARSSATRLTDGQRKIIHLSVVCADRQPINPASDLYQSLVLALRQFGAPYQPFQVQAGELVLLMIWAKIRLLPDYLWQKVEAQVRAALLDALGFEQRDLGQGVVYSEVVSAIQAVPGVAYVDLEYLDAVERMRLTQFLESGNDPAVKPETTPASLVNALNLTLRTRIPCRLAQLSDAPPPNILPAQMAFLSSEVKHMLVLEEIKP